MLNQALLLTSLLKGATPILRYIRDSRGWGTYGYTLKKVTKFSSPLQGYSSPQQNGKTLGVKMLCPKLISSFGP
jgi:hypothetical protein